MKVLAILPIARLREDFVEVVQKTEECELEFFNPYTGGPEDIKKEIEEDGFDFVIYDYGPPTDRSAWMIDQIRLAIPSTPILVFTMYEYTRDIVAKEKCSSFNWSAHYTWREDGQKLLTESIEEARDLVA